MSMKKILKKAALLTGLGLLFLFSAPPVGGAADLTPKEILDRVDDLFRGKSSKGIMTMSITTAHWSRSLTLEFWSEGKDKSLIRILAPQKEKGTATLRVDKDMWNYLAKTKRVIKLPSSMMSASWMGSHFTNDDLVKESRMADDYTFEVTGRREEEGHPVVEIDCRPKPDAAVVWGKVLLTVLADAYLPLSINYYDEQLDLARTMTFSDVGDLGGRNLPRFLVMQPADKPEERTEIKYDQMDFNIDLEPDTFSLRSLRR